MVCIFFLLKSRKVKLTHLKINWEQTAAWNSKKNLKIKRTYLNVYESEKKLNKIGFLKKISNYYKIYGTKRPVKVLSFLIYLVPDTLVPMWVHIFKSTKIVIKSE